MTIKKSRLITSEDLNQIPPAVLERLLDIEEQLSSSTSLLLGQVVTASSSQNKVTVRCSSSKQDNYIATFKCWEKEGGNPELGKQDLDNRTINDTHSHTFENLKEDVWYNCQVLINGVKSPIQEVKTQKYIITEPHALIGVIQSASATGRNVPAYKHMVIGSFRKPFTVNWTTRCAIAQGDSGFTSSTSSSGSTNVTGNGSINFQIITWRSNNDATDFIFWHGDEKVEVFNVAMNASKGANLNIYEDIYEWRD